MTTSLLIVLAFAAGVLVTLAVVAARRSSAEVINRGRVVAVDTPDNLTARLRGSEAMYVQVEPGGADVKAALERVPGVTQVTVADARGPV